jgi:hypothetical protein
MKRRLPLYDATAPIACTITTDEVAGRVESLERMRTHLTELERIEHGLVLHFPPRPDLEADLRRFAVDEQRCCAFWGFEVSTTPDDLALRWDGPPAAADVLARLEAFLVGDDPGLDLGGLL